MSNELFEPTNFSRSQIEELARLFAERTNYIPCDNDGKKQTDIFKYVTSIGGVIRYSDAVFDLYGGSLDISEKLDGSFTINLSKFTSPKRDIFTIAHELGHYVLHSKLGTKKISARRSSEETLSEKEANTFALEFLMPTDSIKQKFKECKGNMAELVSMFNVSASAMLYRCKDLGLH